MQRTTQCKILGLQEGQKPALEITPNGGEIIARSVGLPGQSPPPFQHVKSKYAANIAITCRTRSLAAGALRSQDGFFVQDTMQWALWRGAHVRCFLCALRIIDRESVCTHAEEEFTKGSDGWGRLSDSASNTSQLTTLCPGECLGPAFLVLIAVIVAVVTNSPSRVVAIAPQVVFGCLAASGHFPKTR